MQIGAYKTITPFVTAGSGNARWCIAVKDGKQYFIKQFLSPVQPVQITKAPTKQVLLRREKCAVFETQKLRLYEQLRLLPKDHIVHVEDFFVFDGHYYAVSAYLGTSYQTFETFHPAQYETKRRYLLSLSQCLRALHAAGVVHADLKPEHIVVGSDPDTPSVRLIDFDSGFMGDSPPSPSGGMDVDPVYMSPEAYLLITGKKIKLNCKLDTFTFGLLAHQCLTGELPGFDREKYTYPYAAVLDDKPLLLSDEIDGGLRNLIQKTLRKNPALRPRDDTICKALNTAHK